MTGEYWLAVVGFEGRYEVSNMGRVRSLLNNKQRRRRAPLLRRTARTKAGYNRVGLCVDIKITTRIVGPLVLEAFVGPAPSGTTCDHVNRNRGDDRLENLRWATAIQQCANRGDVARRGEHHGNARLRDADVRDIRRRFSDGQSVKTIAAALGLSYSLVWTVATRRTWKHLQDAA